MFLGRGVGGGELRGLRGLYERRSRLFGGAVVGERCRSFFFSRMSDGDGG